MEKSIGNIETQGLTFEKVWAMFQETSKQIKELSESQHRTDEQIKEINKTVGGVSNAIGGIIESIVSGGLSPVLEKEIGCKIHTVAENLRYKEAEIDSLFIGKQPNQTKQDVFILKRKWIANLTIGN